MTGTSSGQYLQPLSRSHMPRRLETACDGLTRARIATKKFWLGAANCVGLEETPGIADCGGQLFADLIGAMHDLEIIADLSICAGNEEVGIHLSQRARLCGLNDRKGPPGPATESILKLPMLANLVVRSGKIVLEHRLCNTAALIQELGHDPWDLAAKKPAKGRDLTTWQALRRAASPHPALSASDPVSGFDPDAYVRDIHHRLWAMADFAVLSTHYARGFSVEGPTRRPLAGAEAYEAYVRAFRASFPDLRHQVDEVYWMGNRSDGFHISTRWSAEATHAGTGIFGRPSGADVQIWGITQQEVKGATVQREFLLFNTFDLMCQITAQRG